jgi:hypothetical protein
MSRSMLRSGRVWFALVFGGVLLLPGLLLVGRTLYRLVTYETANGTAGFESRGRRGISSYRITYYVEGKSYSLREAAASWLGLGYGAEEPVKVIYPASDPAAGVVSTFYNLWFWPLFVFLGPLGFVLPVANWARQGLEDDRLAALGAEGQETRDRDMRRRWRQRRERRGRGDY